MSHIVRLSLGVRRVFGSFILIIVILYVILVLFPSYWSGIYNLSSEQIWQGSFDVPFYSGSGSVREAVFPRVPAFISIAAWYLVPFLSLFLFVTLIITRHTLTRRDQFFWIASILII